LNKPKSKERKKLPLHIRLMMECPPFLAYAAAKRQSHGKAWIGLDELCRRSGLPRRTVIRLGSKITWDGVKADVIGRFLKACNIDLCKWNLIDTNRLHAYLRAQFTVRCRPFQHLNHGKQYSKFNERCEKWIKLTDKYRD